MRLGTLFLALAVTTPLAAQTAHRTSLTTDLGFVNTAGNTEITTLNLGEKLGYHTADSLWLFSQFASAVYGRTSGQETANQLAAGVRLDRGLGARSVSRRQCQVGPGPLLRHLPAVRRGTGTGLAVGRIGDRPPAL